MHGLPDWFGWAITAVYYGAYVVPAVVAVAGLWYVIRRRNRK